MSSRKWPTREVWPITVSCHLRYTLNKQKEISDIYKSNQIILDHAPEGCACIVYDCSSENRFEEKSRQELKDYNHTKYSRGLRELHERALLVLKLPKYHPTLATCYNNIGEIYGHLRDYENALKNLEHALDIRLKGTVSTHTDLAAIYINLGYVYDKTKSFEKALEMYEKALKIDTEALPENHPSLAVSHNNIGSVYQSKGDFTRALYHYETAVRIMLKSDAKNNAGQLATYQHNLGCLQLSLGNNTKAMKMLERALKIQLEYLPKGHENLSKTYETLSLVYEKEGQIATALEYLEKSLENARISLLPHNVARFNQLQARMNLLKAQHFSENKTTEKLISMQANTYNTYEQDDLITQCTEELKTIPSEDFLGRISLLNTLGTMHSTKANYSMAMKCFEDAISLYNQHHSLISLKDREWNNLMIIVYFNLARLYYRQNQLAEAFVILEKSLDLASEHDVQITILPEVYNFAGIMFTYKRDLSKAEYYFNLAIDIAKKSLPNNHPDLQRYYLQLKQLKDHM